MSDGPPTPFNPSPTDHLNFAPQTRKYRKDRSIRALGMLGIPTGGTSRPLYGLGKMTEDIIVAARGSQRTNNGIEQQVTGRPTLASGEDGSVDLLRPNLPAKQVKQKESGPPRPSPSVPTSTDGLSMNVPGGDWGPSVTA